MNGSAEQELREFIRLKRHSHELKNQQLGQSSLFRDQGVGGSNPLSPTIFSNTYKLRSGCKWVQLAITLPQIEAEPCILSSDRAFERVPLHTLESILVGDAFG